MHPLDKFKFCPKCGSSRFVENNFKSKVCVDCRFIYYFNSSSSTVAVIVNSKNEILVATRKHDPAKGTFDLPGGFVDMDESAESAVMREVKEETGLVVKSIRYLFSIPNRYVYSDFEVLTTDLFFMCEIDENDVFVASDDVMHLQFIPIGELKASSFGLESIQVGVTKIQSLIL